VRIQASETFRLPILIADCRLAVGVLSHLAAVSAATKDTNRSCRKEIGNQKSAIRNGFDCPLSQLLRIRSQVRELCTIQYRSALRR
jgi:hypothetical protein